MGMLHQLEEWSTTHHPRWLVFLRVALGICLIIKGISFMNDSVGLESLLAETSMGFTNTWLPIFITWVHMLGGFFIIVGLFTRVATLFLIPVLLGAVFFVNIPRGIFAPGSEFGFSLVVLLLLIFFFIEGGGPLSLDDYFKRNPR
ncbi:DoxX family protein [Terrimonas alba]|uniref:DoxX family protein n=1 Tax=Terrimonas alba TaxID=3349636 RepID=UPI0036DC99D6